VILQNRLKSLSSGKAGGWICDKGPSNRRELAKKNDVRTTMSLSCGLLLVLGMGLKRGCNLFLRPSGLLADLFAG